MNFIFNFFLTAGPTWYLALGERSDADKTFINPKYCFLTTTERYQEVLLYASSRRPAGNALQVTDEV